MEHLIPIEECKDETIELFLDIQKSMPELDHISANKQLRSEGSLKRLIDMMPQLSWGEKSPDT